MSSNLGREHGVVLPMAVDPVGRVGPTWRAVVGQEWRRSSRGLYVATSVPVTPAQRIAEVGVLLPAKAYVTGWASLRWRGGWWFGGSTAGGAERPVQVAMPRSLLREQAAFTICTERWDHRELEVVDGLQVGSAVRSICFEMRYAAHPEDALAALEMACFHDLVSVDEASTWIDWHPSYTGIEQAREARDLADENAWSPMEHHLRRCWLPHVPLLLCNHPVFDLNGRHMGTPDVIDPRTGVLGEYDGGLHLEGARRAADLRREHDFRVHGLEPVTMLSQDAFNPGPFKLRLRTAYHNAEQRPASERRWTLELPDWWVPTFTVEQRRALSESQRRTWLKNRLPPSSPIAGIVPDAPNRWPA
ncbi:MAG TPA: hypothetical protein VFI19_04870 [Nocardioides sp.]|nr:hypothetical protein [Nocardioides sp.]